MKDKSTLLPQTENEKQQFYGIELRNNKELYESMIDSAQNEFREFLLYERKISTDWQHKLLIAPNSKWKSIFDLVVLLMVNLSCFILFYNICFDAYHEFNVSPLYIIIEVCFAASIVLTFFQKYQDAETLAIVSSYRKIALRYVKGWFFIDFISVFPFELFFRSKADLLKLLRLLRLPKFIQSIDMKRFDTITSSFWQSDNLLLIFNLRYIFKILRMLIIGIILTYFIGCLWFLFCNSFKSSSPTQNFIERFGLGKKQPYEQLIICCYFVLTTLTTVGYGDYVATNDHERLLAIVIMFLGVLMFSYIMSSFTDHISLYNQSFADVDKGSTLQNWLFLLNKFTKNHSFDPKLIGSIDKHFSYFWANDRISSFTSSEPFLASLSKNLKMKIVDFLWLDVYCKFSHFFNYSLFKDKHYKFYYELSFCLLPRKFSPGEIVFFPKEEVEEMYLITDGQVKIGYDYGNNDIKFYLTITSGDYIGSMYCLYNIQTDYRYVATREMKAFGINKFDLLNLLKAFPEISDLFRAKAYSKYKTTVKELMDQSIVKEFEAKEDMPIDMGEYIKPMVKEDANKNGMRVDAIIKEKLDEKQRAISEIEKRIEAKVKELRPKYESYKAKIEQLSKKCDEDIKRRNRGKIKIEDDYFGQRRDSIEIENNIKQ